MINGSFVFGMDEDDETVFDRTVEWAVGHGIETATFHILTPYPSTALHARIRDAGRILHENWDLYDTRHCVYRPARMDGATLEAGYWRAYRQFYTWGSIFRGAWPKTDWRARLRHLAYASAWKKFEPMWDLIIRTKRVARMLPILETILDGGKQKPTVPEQAPISPENRLPESSPGKDERAKSQQRPVFASADLFD